VGEEFVKSWISGPFGLAFMHVLQAGSIKHSLSSFSFIMENHAASQDYHLGRAEECLNEMKGKQSGQLKDGLIGMERCLDCQVGLL